MLHKKTLILITFLTLIFSLVACGGSQTPVEDVVPQISMRVVDGVIQYQVEGQAGWRNLLSVSDLEGQDGVGVQSASVNNSGELIVTYSDGTSQNLGVVQGRDAQTPISVVSFNINSDGELVVTYSDNTTQNLGLIRQPSATPRQVQSFTVNADSELIVVYNDGTVENLGSVQGLQGAPGTDGVIGEDGLSAFDLYVEANPLYTKTVAQWLIDLADNLLSSAEYFDVLTAADIADVAANRPEVTSIQLQADIVGDVAFTRPLNINFNGYDIKGNVSITSAAIANVSFVNLYSGSTSVITGSLTVDLENTSLTNHIDVGGDVIINAIGSTTYRALSQAQSIVLRGPGHVSLPVTQSAIPVIIETAEPVVLSGTFDSVSINATNASVNVLAEASISSFTISQPNVRIDLGSEVEVTTMTSSVPVNVALGKDAVVTTPPSGGNYLQRATLTFNGLPTGAALVVKDSTGLALTPTALNTFEVAQGQTYSYSVTAANFVASLNNSITISQENTTQTVSLNEALLVTQFSGENNTLTLSFNRPLFVEDLEIKNGVVTYFGDFVPIQDAWGNITPAIILGWLLQETQYSFGSAGYNLNYDYADFLGEGLAVTESAITVSITSNAITFSLPAGSITSASITTESAIKELVTINTSFLHLEDETPFDGASLLAVFAFNKVGDAVVTSLQSQAQYSSVSVAALSAAIEALPTPEAFAYSVTNIALTADAETLRLAIDNDPLRSLDSLAESLIEKLEANKALINVLNGWESQNIFAAADNATGSALAVVIRVVDENSLFVRRLEFDNDALTISSTGTLNLGVFAPAYSETILNLQPGDVIYITGERDEFRGLNQISDVTRLDLYTPSAIAIDESDDISGANFTALANKVGTLVALDEYLVTGIFVTDAAVTVTLGSIVTPDKTILLVYRGDVPTRSAERAFIEGLEVGTVVNITSMALDWFNGPRLRLTSLDEISIVDEIEFSKLEDYLPSLFPEFTYLDLDLFTEFSFGGWDLVLSWASNAEGSISTQGAVNLTMNAVDVLLTAVVTPTGISSGAISASSIGFNVQVASLNVMSAIDFTGNTVALDGVVSKVISDNLVLIETDSSSVYVWDESGEGAFANLNLNDEIRVIGLSLDVSGLKVINVASEVSRLSVLRSNVTLPGVVVELSDSDFTEGDFNAALQGKRVGVDDLIISAIEVTASSITLTLEQLVSDVAITLVYEGALNLPAATHLQTFVTGQAVLLTNVAVGAGVVFYTDASEIQSTTLSAVHMLEYFKTVVSVPTSTTESITLPSSFTQGQNNFSITWTATGATDFIDSTGFVTKPAIYESDESAHLTAEFSYLGSTQTETFNITILAIGPTVVLETFADAPLTATNLDGSFTGVSNLEWEYGHSRNVGDYPIDGSGIMLRRGSDSFLKLTLPNGFESITFDYRKAFTGTFPRQLELLINGEQVLMTPIFGTESGADDTVFQLVYNAPQFIEGEVEVIIRDVQRNSSNRHVVINNVAVVAPGVPFEEQLNSVFKIPEQVFEGAQLNLATELVLSDGNTYTIEWTSSDYSTISRRGLVREIETLSETVNLTAKVFLNGEEVSELNYSVEVQAPLTISQVLGLPNNTEVLGIYRVIGFQDHETFFVADENGDSIAVVGTSDDVAELELGQIVTVFGRRTTFRGLSRIGSGGGGVRATIVVIEEDNAPTITQPNLQPIDGLEFSDNSVMLPYQSKLISLEEAIITNFNIDSFESIQITLLYPISGETIELRYDNRLVDSEDAFDHLNTFDVGDVMSLNGVVLGWSDGARLIYFDASQVTALPTLSEEGLNAYFEIEFPFLIPATVTTDVTFPTTIQVGEATFNVSYDSDKPEFFTDLGIIVIRPAEGEDDEIVTLTITVADGNGYTHTFNQTVTVLAETSEPILAFHFNFEETTNLAGSGYSATGFNLTNLVDNSSFIATPSNEVQHTTSSNAPHNTQGRFLAMRSKSTDSFVEFDFSIEITQISFRTAIWSSADFGRIDQMVSIELQVYNSDTEDWDTVIDFLSIIENSTEYFNVNVDNLSGHRFRFYGVQDGSGDVRITLDDLRAYTPQ